MTKSGASSIRSRRCKTRLTRPWATAPSEATIRRRIVQAVQRRWPKAWVYHPSERFRSGIPDLLIIVPPHGRLLAIEVKTPTMFPTRLQVFTLTAIRQAGGSAHILRDPSEVADVTC